MPRLFPEAPSCKMAFLQSISLHSPLFLLPSPSRPSPSPSSLRSAALFPHLQFKPSQTTPSRKFSNAFCSSSSPRSKLHSIEDYNNDNLKYDEKQADAMFEAVKQSEYKGILPSVRTYQNDLAKLTVVGAVDLEQALTASAADGGDAANQHLVNGLDAMVVETVFPGREDEHSTVSTRLFLPARKVKEKAKNLRSYLTEDILSSTTSKNILALTFRQVQVQQLWNFELVLFPPGSERDMEMLDSPREVPVSFTLTSNSKSVLSVLAEAICILALESTERDFFNGSSRNVFFGLFLKTERISSKDSSVTVYRLEEEIIGNAKNILEKFSVVKAKYDMIKKKPKFSWWTSSLHPTLESIGGLDFCTWASEYIPAYRLEIDADKLSDLKFEGWTRTAINKWEALLTPSQMVGLANILDLYLEDPYTLPDKQLSCGVAKNPKKLSNSKRGSSWLKILSTILASAVFVVSIGALGQICFPHLHTRRKDSRQSLVPRSSECTCVQLVSLEAHELEAFCTAIIRKIKDSYGWTAEIKSESSVGAWIGELPIYLRKRHESDSNDENISTGSEFLNQGDERYNISAQDIASYQVVLSADGKIIGFQPTSRVAVNHWAANPLAKELHRKKKLSPGILEPWLKISKPGQVIVLELLISVNPEAYFALSRPAS